MKSISLDFSLQLQSLTPMHRYLEMAINHTVCLHPDVLDGKMHSQSVVILLMEVSRAQENTLLLFFVLMVRTATEISIRIFLWVHHSTHAPFRL